jgi:hypothetical protein
MLIHAGSNFFIQALYTDKDGEQSLMRNKLILIFPLVAQRSMILKQGTGCLTFQGLNWKFLLHTSGHQINANKEKLKLVLFANVHFMRT